LVAADGGARLCLAAGLRPHAVIGDFDSLSEAELADLQAGGALLQRHQSQKDETDLELAFHYALDQGVEEILLLGALGDRWDMTLANLFMLAQPAFTSLRLRIYAGNYEITILRGGESIEIHSAPGDTYSLLPIGGAASGITTQGLFYPLEDGTLELGSPRGVSNVLIGSQAMVKLTAGMLLCIHIHHSGGMGNVP
jgi:thiamine pyrophosphokinase